MTGAFMPSVDGVGRYFPLCICACADPGEDISPPGAKPMHRWFDKAETALLKALEAGFAGEPPALLEGLDLDLAVRGDDPGEIEVTRLLSEGLQAALSRDSWWWSIGGGGFPVQMRRLQGLPDAYQFADFMTHGSERQSRISA